MFRLRVVRTAVALVALSVPAGVVAAGSTEPDDSTAESGADDTTEPGNSTPPSGTVPDGTASDDAGEGVTPPEDIEFEIDMMLGLVPQAEMDQHWADQEEGNQLAIQACMNESGFDYELENYPDMSSGMGGLEWGSPEFAEQYGFGTWTTMDPETNGMDMSVEYEWPNEDIVSALTPEEQNAWYQVQGQCSNDIYMSQDNLWRNPDVQQIMEDFYSDVENDPRVREAQAGWVDCMEAAGFPYPSPEDMYQDISAGDDETYELHNQFYESEAWLETSEDHDQWQALVDHEIEVAVANAACEPAVTEARETVQRDLREDLVAVWQTIDWSQPPVTFEGEDDVYLMPGESLPLGSETPEGTDLGSSDGSAAPTETTEPPVGLDLGAPTETTEP